MTCPGCSRSQTDSDNYDERTCPFCGETFMPRRPAEYLLFWTIDPDQLQRQVTEYSSLGVFQSARGRCALWLVFLAVVSVFPIYFRKSDYYLVDAVAFLVLAVFVYRGHRWATICAMLLWTFERVAQFHVNLQAHGLGLLESIIVPVFWWALFMRFFYAAFRVEQQRRTTSVTVAS